MGSVQVPFEGRSLKFRENNKQKFSRLG